MNWEALREDLRERLGWPQIVLLVLIGCGLLVWGWSAYQESQPLDRFPYALSTSGGPPGWPVWVEKQRLRGAVGKTGGSVRDLVWDEPPDGGKSAVYARDLPAPKGLRARWFSYREQVFYEIDIDFPEDLEARMRRWYRRYPDEGGYYHRLMLGYAGDGRARVWWRISCTNRPECGEDDTPHYFPIIEEAHSEEVQGEPVHYREQTIELRDEGRIPEDVEVPE